MNRPNLKRAELERFLEDRGILHTERIEFSADHFVIWSYRRDKDGNYVKNPSRHGERILDVERFAYAP